MTSNFLWWCTRCKRGFDPRDVALVDGERWCVHCVARSRFVGAYEVVDELVTTNSTDSKVEPDVSVVAAREARRAARREAKTLAAARAATKSLDADQRPLDHVSKRSEADQELYKFLLRYPSTCRRLYQLVVSPAREWTSGSALQGILVCEVLFSPEATTGGTASAADSNEANEATRKG